MPRRIGKHSSQQIEIYDSDGHTASNLDGIELAINDTSRDAEIAQALQEELDENESKQARLANEIAALEEQERLNAETGATGFISSRGTTAGKGKAHTLDYMRPKNHRPWFTITIFVICAVMMVVEIWQNGWTFESLKVNPLVGPSNEVLIQLGAKRTDLIVGEGQTWRLITPMFLHGGIAHLVVNMFGLNMVGMPMEREFGWWRVAIIYFLSGIMGILFSAVFVPDLVSVGASGAIFGLFGSGWADLLQNWSLYRNKAWTEFWKLLVSTLINLIVGILPMLDNFAHVGGFITGLFLGFSLLIQTRYNYKGRKKNRREYQMMLQGLAVIVLPMAFGIMFLVLYLKVDAGEWCKWCHYISCVEIPPSDPWWDCGACATTLSKISESSNLVQDGATGLNYLNMTCPDTTRRNFNISAEDYSGLQVEAEAADVLLRLCEANCPNAV